MKEKKFYEDYVFCMFAQRMILIHGCIMSINIMNAYEKTNSSRYILITDQEYCGKENDRLY